MITTLIEKGQVCVNIQPESVRDFVKWCLINNNEKKEPSSIWFKSGQTISIPYGEYTVIGEEIAGWTIETNNIKINVSDITILTPETPSENATTEEPNLTNDMNPIVIGEEPNLTNDMNPIVIHEETVQVLDLKYIMHGNLKIKINDEVAKTEARWRIVNTNDWFFDGDEIDLKPDSYEIEFDEINNFVKPDNKFINVISNQTKITEVNYEPYGSIRVNIAEIENDAITETTKWRVKNIDTLWRESMDYASLKAGDYQIEFNVINNIYTHSDIDVVILKGQTIEENVTFEGLHLLVVPTRKGLYSYNHNNLQKLNVFDSSQTEINQVAFNNAGTMMAAALQKTPFLKIYNCFDFEEIYDKKLELPPSGCRSICFSNDNQYLVVSHNTVPYITIYETETWDKITLSDPPSSYCNSIIFDNGDQYLIVGYNKEPYLSIYNVTSDFTKIVLDDYPDNDVLSLKYNFSDLVVGCQEGIFVYDNSFSLKKTVLSSLVNGGIYGIECVSNDLIVATSLYIYIYQLDDYRKVPVVLPVKSNVNTYIKTDPNGRDLIISGLRKPNVLVYNRSDWSLREFDEDIGYSKKFDISKDLSDRSFVKVPKNISPSNNTKGLKIGDSLVSSDFEYFTNTATVESHQMSHWRIFDDANEIVDESITSADLIEYPVPLEYFDLVKEYTWQVRHKGLNFGWSFWSKPTSFITAYAYIEKPVNSDPEHNSEDVREDVTLKSSVFTSINMADTHILSEWKIFEIINSDYVEVFWSGAVSENLTSIYIDPGILQGKTVSKTPEYAWSVRYKGALIGWSDWSDKTHFKTGSWGIEKPINIYPKNEQGNVNGDNLIFVSSPFTVTGTIDQHSHTSWIVYDSLNNIVYHPREEPITNPGGNIELRFPREMLESGEKVYKWKVRYKGINHGWSDWSNLTTLTTKPLEYSYITVNTFPTGLPQVLKWRWKVTSAGSYSDYILPGVETEIMSNQTITIQFEPYIGYIEPAPMDLQLVPGSKYNITARYELIAGAIKITTTPSNGKWRVKGTSSWKSSGFVLNNLVNGNYEIEYDELVNFQKPPDETVTVVNNGLIELTRTYTLIPGTLYSIKVVCDPATSYWKIDGRTAWIASGEVYSDLIGVVSGTISFFSIPGRITPTSIPFTIPGSYTTNPDPSVVRQILFNVTYQDANLASLTVDLNVGAWRIVGDIEWYNSGFTKTLEVGSYEIEFQEIEGYKTPPKRSFILRSGQNLKMNVTYGILGDEYIRINIIPSVVWARIKYRVRNSEDNGTTWSGWSNWFDYFDGASLFNIIQNPVKGVYKIEINTFNGYEPKESIKTITYTSGIREIKFEYEKIHSDENIINILIQPTDARERSTYRYRNSVDGIHYSGWSNWISAKNDKINNPLEGYYQFQVSPVSGYFEPNVTTFQYNLGLEDVIITYIPVAKPIDLPIGGASLKLKVNVSEDGGLSYKDASESFTNSLRITEYDYLTDASKVSTILLNNTPIRSCNLTLKQFNNEAFVNIASKHIYLYRIKEVSGYRLIENYKTIASNVSNDQDYEKLLRYHKVLAENICFEIVVNQNVTGVIAPFIIEMCAGFYEHDVKIATIFPMNINFSGTTNQTPSGNVTRLISQVYKIREFFGYSILGWIKPKLTSITGSGYKINVNEVSRNCAENIEINNNTILVKNIGNIVKV